MIKIPKHQAKNDSKRSDKFINIRGVLFKATNSTLKRHKPTYRSLVYPKPKNNLVRNSRLRYRWHSHYYKKDLFHKGGKEKLEKSSQKFVNIGGILYNSTKTSLKKHNSNAKLSRKSPLKSNTSSKNCKYNIF